MRFLLRRERARFGFRGRFVAHISVVWIILGLAQFLSPMRHDAEALEHSKTVLLIANLPVLMQALMWFVPALIALCFARTNPTRPTDRTAFVSLIVPPAITTLSFAWAFIYNVSVRHDAIWIYLTNVLIWGVFLSLVLSLAGWPEPPTGDTENEPH